MARIPLVLKYFEGMGRTKAGIKRGNRHAQQSRCGVVTRESCSGAAPLMMTVLHGPQVWSKIARTTVGIAKKMLFIKALS